MADANGSYSAAKAIEIGKRLQEMKYLWFEEPCPWEELSETKKVADALIHEDRVRRAGFQPVAVPVDDREQRDGGGAARSELQRRLHPRRARGPHGAQGANLWICPHNTQTGAASVNILQFAASTPNIGPYMEYVWRAPQKKESWYSPNFEIRTA